MNKNFKKALVSVLALTSVVAMAACTSKAPADNTASTSDWEYISEKGNMVIGYTLFAPMNYMDGDELIGFETDFAKAVSEKLGVEADFVEINWDAKEIELSSKQIDCIWNGMTITPEREENMSITMPYMENRQVMIVKSENVDKYSDSLDGANVVAEAGSAGEELATEDEMFANAAFTAVDSQAKGLMDVAAGVSDVVIVDYTLALGSVGEGTDYADLAIIDKDFENMNYGVAFRKGSDITTKVNEAMSELKADGTLDEIADKYNLSDLLIVE